MLKKCTVCGKEVEIPAKIDREDERLIKCHSCGAVAFLWVRRNGNVKGLKSCFIKDLFNFLKK